MKIYTKLFVNVFSIIFLFCCSEGSRTEPINTDPPPDNVEFRSFINPIPFTWKGKTICGYEVHGYNFIDTDYEVVKVELYREDENGELLEYYKGDTFQSMYRPQKESSMTIGAVIFLWVEFASRADVPNVIHHKLFLSNGSNVKIYTHNVEISKKNPIVIQPPVRGNYWYCGNGPSNDLFNYHRTAIMSFQTRPFCAQRFAVDFLRMSQNKYLIDPAADINNIKNEDFYTFGDTLYAVADGVVFSARDGLEDIEPGQFPPINFDHADGNYILLEIEYNNGISLDTVYANYAHMVKGSLMYKIGDKVKAGDPIGLLGNSGNTTGPHLHFHLSDRGYGLMLSQGIPYEIESFHLFGIVTNSEQLSEGMPLQATFSQENTDISNESIAIDYLINF